MSSIHSWRESYTCIYVVPKGSSSIKEKRKKRKTSCLERVAIAYIRTTASSRSSSSSSPFSPFCFERPIHKILRDDGRADIEGWWWHVLPSLQTAFRSSKYLKLSLFFLRHTKLSSSFSCCEFWTFPDSFNGTSSHITAYSWQLINGSAAVANVHEVSCLDRNGRCEQQYILVYVSTFCCRRRLCLASAAELPPRKVAHYIQEHKRWDLLIWPTRNNTRTMKRRPKWRRSKRIPHNRKKNYKLIHCDGYTLESSASHSFCFIF